MRLLFRVFVLALAAFGAKTLYDLYQSRGDDLKRVGSDLVDHVGAAARDVGAQATDAGQQVSEALQRGAAAVATTAQQRAVDVQADLQAAASAAGAPDSKS
jgi:hypothetical protein